MSQAAVEADSISEVLGDFGVLIEGGGYSTMSLHSALAQAYYYHSRYQDAGREFILFGLPCYEEGRCLYGRGYHVWRSNGGVLSCAAGV